MKSLKTLVCLSTACLGLTLPLAAQIEIAESLLIDIDATGLPEGPISSVENFGDALGYFEATGGGDNQPYVIAVGGNGTRGILFDGNDYMEHVDIPGGVPLPAAPGLVGPDPTRTIEVWVFNVTVPNEETLVSWGHRGGPAGSNMSFNYGTHGAFGAVGHWDYPDIGWNNAGGAPAPGRWHHLVYTYDGTTTRVYADGVLANSEVLGPGIINTHSGTPITLAAQRSSDGGVEPGLRGSLVLARVRVHDGVLTDEQILANYLAEKDDFTNGTPVALTRGPIHRYTFNEPAVPDATGLLVPDVVGGADGVIMGSGAAFTGTELTLPGGNSDAAPYVDLPNGLLSSLSSDLGGSGELTVETWVTLQGNRSWSRIWDFGSGTAGELIGPGGSAQGTDYFFLSAQIGGNRNVKRCEIRNDDPVGGGIPGGVIEDYGSYGLNSKLHVAVTWNENTGEVIIYENGVQVATFHTDIRFSNINDVNVWLGRSNWTADQNMQGAFDEFRIYDRVLSPQEVLNNYQAGPDAIVTTPGALQAIDLQLAAGQMWLQAFQNVQVLAHYENVSNVNVTLRPELTLSSDNTSVVEITPDGQLHAVGVGTATITATFEGQSDSETVTVVPWTATLVHRYSFNGDTIDSVGGADAILQGGALLTDEGVELDAASQSYVQLPAGILDGYDAVSIEAWASFGPNSGWCRLFDFGDINASGLGRNYIFFSPHSGPGDTRMSIADADPGYEHEQIATAPGVLDGRSFVHVVTVYIPTARRMEMYIDGCLAALNTNIAITLDGVNDLQNFLGRSLYAPDPYLNGTIHEFRIYQGILTADRVAINAAAGPDALVEEPGALQAIHLQINPNMVVEGVQQAIVLADYANVTGVNVCGIGTPVFTSSNPDVVAVAPDGTLTALDAGTATIEVSFSGLSDSQTITVAPLPVTLKHRYSFNEPSGNIVVEDRVGDADGILINGADFTGSGQAVLDGVDDYVNLPNGIISALTNATFEAWVTYTGNSSWARVFDFGSSVDGEDAQGGGVNYVFLAAQGGPGFRFAAKPTGAGESPVLNGPGPLPQGIETHIVVTYNVSGGVARLYTNGVLVASGPVTMPLSALDDFNNWLGRSQYNDPYFAGSFNEFRIYEGAMTAAQVAASYAAGPDAPISGARLQIALSNGQVILSWPVAAGNFVLESSPNLGPNAVWTEVTEIPALVDDHYEVTLPATQATEFFRLREFAP